MRSRTTEMAGAGGPSGGMTVGQALDLRLLQVADDWPTVEERYRREWENTQEWSSLIEAALEVADGDPDLALDAVADALLPSPEAKAIAFETLSQPGLREQYVDYDGRDGSLEISDEEQDELSYPIRSGLHVKSCSGMVNEEVAR